MPQRPCPACGTDTPRRLDSTSEVAAVNYYRCARCGHVWTVDKQDPSIVTHITPLSERSKPS